jgi:hypothetical protein
MPDILNKTIKKFSMISSNIIILYINILRCYSVMKYSYITYWIANYFRPLTEVYSSLFIFPDYAKSIQKIKVEYWVASTNIHYKTYKKTRQLSFSVTKIVTSLVYICHSENKFKSIIKKCDLIDDITEIFSIGNLLYFYRNIHYT